MTFVWWYGQAVRQGPAEPRSPVRIRVPPFSKMQNLYITKGLVRHNNKYLLLKKAKDTVPGDTGKWECPGGKIIPEEDPAKAILREVEEETGLKCNLIKELPFLEMKNDKVNSKCHVFLLESDSDQVTLSDEHTGFLWKLPEEVRQMELVLFADLLLKYFNHAEKYLATRNER